MKAYNEFMSENITATINNKLIFYGELLKSFVTN
jgi:hypothetical protein